MGSQRHSCWHISYCYELASGHKWSGKGPIVPSLPNAPSKKKNLMTAELPELPFKQGDRVKYLVMAYIVMAYIVMAYTVMAPTCRYILAVG